MRSGNKTDRIFRKMNNEQLRAFLATFEQVTVSLNELRLQLTSATATPSPPLQKITPEYLKYLLQYANINQLYHIRYISSAGEAVEDICFGTRLTPILFECICVKGVTFQWYFDTPSPSSSRFLHFEPVVSADVPAPMNEYPTIKPNALYDVTFHLDGAQKDPTTFFKCHNFMTHYFCVNDVYYIKFWHEGHQYNIPKHCLISVVENETTQKMVERLTTGGTSFDIECSSTKMRYNDCNNFHVHENQPIITFMTSEGGHKMHLENVVILQMNVKHPFSVQSIQKIIAENQDCCYRVAFKYADLYQHVQGLCFDAEIVNDKDSQHHYLFARLVDKQHGICPFMKLESTNSIFEDLVKFEPVPHTSSSTTTSPAYSIQQLRDIIVPYMVYTIKYTIDPEEGEKVYENLFVDLYNDKVDYLCFYPKTTDCQVVSVPIKYITSFEANAQIAEFVKLIKTNPSTQQRFNITTTMEHKKCHSVKIDSNAPRISFIKDEDLCTYHIEMRHIRNIEVVGKEDNGVKRRKVEDDVKEKEEKMQIDESVTQVRVSQYSAFKAKYVDVVEHRGFLVVDQPTVYRDNAEIFVQYPVRKGDTTEYMRHYVKLFQGPSDGLVKVATINFVASSPSEVNANEMLSITSKFLKDCSVKFGIRVTPPPGVTEWNEIITSKEMWQHRLYAMYGWKMLTNGIGWYPKPPSPSLVHLLDRILEATIHPRDNGARHHFFTAEASAGFLTALSYELNETKDLSARVELIRKCLYVALPNFLEGIAADSKDAKDVRLGNPTKTKLIDFFDSVCGLILQYKIPMDFKAIQCFTTAMLTFRDIRWFLDLIMIWGCNSPTDVFVKSIPVIISLNKSMLDNMSRDNRTIVSGLSRNIFNPQTFVQQLITQEDTDALCKVYKKAKYNILHDVHLKHAIEQGPTNRINEFFTKCGKPLTTLEMAVQLKDIKKYQTLQTTQGDKVTRDEAYTICATNGWYDQALWVYSFTRIKPTAKHLSIAVAQKHETFAYNIIGCLQLCHDRVWIHDNTKDAEENGWKYTWLLHYVTNLSRMLFNTIFDPEEVANKSNFMKYIDDVLEEDMHCLLTNQQAGHDETCETFMQKAMYYNRVLSFTSDVPRCLSAMKKVESYYRNHFRDIAQGLYRHPIFSADLEYVYTALHNFLQKHIL